MGWFSDYDVNKAMEIANAEKEWTEQQRVDFVKGFESSWRLVKNSGTSNKKLDKGMIDTSYRAIESEDQYLLRQHKWLGRYFGTLIGVLRYYPAEIIKSEGSRNKIIFLISYFKKKPNFVDFIMEVIRAWADIIIELSRNSDDRLFSTNSPTDAQKYEAKLAFEKISEEVGLT